MQGEKCGQKYHIFMEEANEFNEVSMLNFKLQ
jgi:hypothetical protein